MLTSFSFDTLTIPIASSMVGLIPVLINLTFTWLERLSQNARLNLVIQQSNQRITFLSNWLALQEKTARAEQLPAIKGMVSEELNEVYEAFLEAVLEPDKETIRRKNMMAKARSINPFRRFFLIYLPPTTSAAGSSIPCTT